MRHIVAAAGDYFNVALDVAFYVAFQCGSADADAGAAGRGYNGALQSAADAGLVISP
jgi:hypothetical protein